MKKIYNAPSLTMCEVLAEKPLAASGVTGGDTGIGFGGTDSEGGLDPDVKEGSFDFSWE